MSLAKRGGLINTPILDQESIDRITDTTDTHLVAIKIPSHAVKNPARSNGIVPPFTK